MSNAPTVPYSAPRRRRSARAKKALRPWQYGFLAAVGLMTVGAAVAIGLFIGIVNSLPPIDKLEVYEPAQMTKVFDRGGNPIGEFSEQRRQVVPISEIPELVQKAFMAVEDERFQQHLGVDPIGIVRALKVFFERGHFAQGASTITMQTARNVLDEEIGFKKTMRRKAEEAIYAFKIERRYTKAQILGFYLNQISFGAHRGGKIFGVKEAASAFFSKELKDLTLPEIAVLAGIPQLTTDYNPVLNPEASKRRRNQVLDRMLANKVIDQKTHDWAAVQPLVTHPSSSMVQKFPYFMRALEIDLNNAYGLDRQRLKAAGYSITTTVDPQIQEICTQALADGLVQVERKWQSVKPGRKRAEDGAWTGVLKAGDIKLMEIQNVRADGITLTCNQYTGTIPPPAEGAFFEPDRILKRGALLDVRVNSVEGREFTGKCFNDVPVQGSIVVLDAATAEVLAIVGGTDNRPAQFNRAVQSYRQVGSTLKPMFYAAALERGAMMPNDLIDDAEITVGAYSPKNYEKRYFGLNTLIEALEHSRNASTVRLYNYLGANRKTLGMIESFHVGQFGTPWALPAGQLAISLGTVGFSPLQMTAAYQIYANGGIGIRPQLFTSIVNTQGKLIQPPIREERSVLDPITACQMQYMLRQVVRAGTGRGEIGDKFKTPPEPPVYGKTGTTDDCTDAWFVGFTPELVIGVHVGFDQNRSLGKVMTGGKVAGPIWTAALKEILKTRTEWKLGCDVPEGVEMADVCAKTGKNAGSGCGHKVYRMVPFAAGKAPRQRCDGATIQPKIGSAEFVGGSGGDEDEPDHEETGVAEDMGEGFAAAPADPNAASAAAAAQSAEPAASAVPEIPAIPDVPPAPTGDDAGSPPPVTF